MDKKSSNSQLPIKSILEANNEELQYIRDRASGKIKSLTTSLKKFNKIGMNGIEFGSIYTIGGRSGSGKTAFINQIETDIIKLNAINDLAILNFNFEMFARRLIGRKLSRELKLTTKQLYSATGFSSNNVKYNDIIKAEQYLRSNLNNLPIYYIERSGTVEQFVNTILEFHRKYPTKKLVITLDHTVLVRRTAGSSSLDTLY